MKKIIILGLLAYCNTAFSQSELDKYVTSTNTFTEVGNSSHGINAPHDLDFVPGRRTEWWVLNKEANGASVVIFFNAGKSSQSVQFRRDSHNSHFMARSVALAFGDNNYFVSAQEIKSTASASSTFMGPALWSSDTGIFARQHQTNWNPDSLLGSHIDMLHQSPFGMGVAHDNTNVYWYFDGYNGNICKYDFSTPHGVGEDDHSDGRIHRYTNATVTRKPNVPSHMALDKSGKWLYYVDGGASMVKRLNTNSGTVGANIPVPGTANEPLAEYKGVNGATVETVVSSGLNSPCGLDYRDGRLLVSDESTGNIYIYNVASMPAQLVGTIITGGPGVMGLRIDDDNKIWYVNKQTNKLIRIDNPNVMAIPSSQKNIVYTIYPNPASNVVNINLDENGNEEMNIQIYDVAGKKVYSVISQEKQISINTSAWAKGVYTVFISGSNARAVSKIVIQ